MTELELTVLLATYVLMTFAVRWFGSTNIVGRQRIPTQSSDVVAQLAGTTLTIAAAAVVSFCASAAAAHAGIVGQWQPVGKISTDAAIADVLLVDARIYRHCHPMPRHTYCHTKDRLPVHWPPLLGTPPRIDSSMPL